MASRDHGVRAVSWWGTSAPTTRVTISAETYIGAHVLFTVPGRVFGIRGYIDATSLHSHWGLFWHFSDNELQAVRKTFEIDANPTEWVNVWFHPVIRIVPNDDYMVAMIMHNGYYRTVGAVSAHPTVNNITYWAGFQTTSIDPITASRTENTNANGVDILFQPD